MKDIKRAFHQVGRDVELVFVMVAVIVSVVIVLVLDDTTIGRRW